MEHARAALRATARALTIDRATAEVVGALDARGLGCVLLKGPALQRWLYSDGTARGYSDMDVLVPPDEANRAVAILQSIGFVETTLSGITLMRPTHARELFRPRDAARVDLHTTIFGATAPAEEVWRVLSSDTDPLRVGGRVVAVPTQPLLAMIVALHAAHHGERERKPLEDLRRAIARADLPTWKTAADKAAEVGAIEPFAAGIGLVPEGRALLDRLDLAGIRPSAHVRLKAATAPPLAEGLAWVSSQRRLRDKALLVAARLFPSPRFMRNWSPLARRGPLGLALSYPWRLLWVMWRAPAAVAAWRKAKR